MSFIALTVSVADVDRDPISGRKLLNQYEIIDELGRGVHGKVKLGRNVETGQDVAIKIVDRYSKRRRLGKLGDPEDNVKREVAILKKAIHPNVVALHEVIDDPAKKKVYIVLEYVQLGEIRWRWKGVRRICEIERRRYERGARGEDDDVDCIQRERLQEDTETRTSDEGDGAGAQLRYEVTPQHWSLEHGGGLEDEVDEDTEDGRGRGTRASATAIRSDDRPAQPKPPCTGSAPSPTRSHSHPVPQAGQLWSKPQSQSDGIQWQLASRQTVMPSSANHEQSMSDVEDSNSFHDRSFGASGGDFISLLEPDLAYDPYEENFSYIPCLTISQARRAFRDTVLGLEYLHYQGIIHRDIKPANLLWTAEYRVKISDFGVSYLGRPIRDDDTGEDLSEADARPLDEAVELAKTVGTPAFYAPELCYTDLSKPRPPVTGQIDLWALGVTLYCLVFAQLPFFARDEFSLFKSIAEDDVFIPKRRLKPVHPHPNLQSSSHSRSSFGVEGDYRSDEELIYQDIDQDLHDLLKRILEKDPTKRITLREVKRHPFTLQGISDPAKWIEDSDPGRQNQGKRIEVSSEEMEKAVVPIGFLARMRSGMRKMGAAIGLGTPRTGRKRAKSGATSRDGASSDTSTSPTPTLKDERRSSLRGDEIMPHSLRFSREVDHPLSQSVTVSPEPTAENPFFKGTQPNVDAVDFRQVDQPYQNMLNTLPGPSALERTVSTSGESAKTIVATHNARDRSANSTPASLEVSKFSTATERGGNANILGVFRGGGSRGSGVHGSNANGNRRDLGERHTSSVENLRNPIDDPHSEPSVALSTASATGHVDLLPHYDQAHGYFDAQLMLPPLSPNRISPISVQPQRVDNQAARHDAAVPTSPFLLSTTPSSRGRGSTLPGSQASSPLEHQMETYTQDNPFWPSGTGRDHPRSVVHSFSEPTTRSHFSAPLGSTHGTEYERQLEADVRRIEWEQQSRAAGSRFNEPSTLVPHSISSSSVDHLASDMSQSTSHPSMPSMISAGSSVSAEDPSIHSSNQALGPLPPRTPKSVLDSFPSQEKTISTPLSDEDQGYNGDTAVETDDDEGDSDEDDFLVMTRRKARGQGSGRSQSVSKAALTRRNLRRGTDGSSKTDRSGSNNTLTKTPTQEEGRRG